VLALGYGLQVSRSALCRALTRLGAKAAPTYARLRAALRASPVAWEDETGWRVAGRLEWLWAGVGLGVTVYDIRPGRGFAAAAALLGEDYAGVLHHDGWRPYYRFRQATHQSCLGHVLRRCRDMVKIAAPTAARFPRAVMQLCQQALTLRDRYRDGAISWHGLAVATGRLEAALARWLDTPYRSAPNRRLAKHLAHERPYLFTFLRCPGGIHATNNAAERALRPAVIARKTWGGNRTHQGAEAQKILASVLRTCRQQGKDSFGRLTALLRSPQEVILDIVPASHSP
jgi:transposase